MYVIFILQYMNTPSVRRSAELDKKEMESGICLNAFLLFGRVHAYYSTTVISTPVQVLVLVVPVLLVLEY